MSQIIYCEFWSVTNRTSFVSLVCNIHTIQRAGFFGHKHPFCHFALLGGHSILTEVSQCLCWCCMILRNHSFMELMISRNKVEWHMKLHVSGEVCLDERKDFWNERSLRGINQPTFQGMKPAMISQHCFFRLEVSIINVHHVETYR